MPPNEKAQRQPEPESERKRKRVINLPGRRGKRGGWVMQRSRWESWFELHRTVFPELFWICIRPEGDTTDGPDAILVPELNGVGTPQRGFSIHLPEPPFPRADMIMSECNDAFGFRKSPGHGILGHFRGKNVAGEPVTE